MTFKPIDQPITAADGRTFRALGQGDVKIELPNGSSTTVVTLKKALYSPDMYYTLISLACMVRAGFQVNFDKDLCTVSYAQPNRRIIAVIPESGALYRIANPYPTEYAKVTKTKMTISELH